MILKLIAYFFFLIFVQLFRIIPFWLLYGLSDFLYFIMFYVVKYRKSVIDKNLKRCFPEKSRNERNQIRKKFYRSICDVIVETLKGYTMSKKQLLRRFISIGHEMTVPDFAQGKDIFVLTAHFANWEWGNATIAEVLNHKPAVLYKPISNAFMEKFVKKRRERFGTDMISIYHSMRYLLIKKSRPASYFLVADQYPTTKEKQKMVEFFGAPTAFLHGPEDFSRQMGVPVYYIEIGRIRRGYYSMKFILLAENPKKLVPTELTQIYAKQLEISIRKQPEDWMWSHKRWKKELYSF